MTWHYTESLSFSWVVPKLDEKAKIRKAEFLAIGRACKAIFQPENVKSENGCHRLDL